MSKPPKISKITLFLWWCSGVEIELLKKLPSEKNKFTVIGASILSATILAILAGSYIFTIVFFNALLGIIFGVMLGILIFILDRYTTSLFQHSTSVTSKLKQAIPGLIISICMATIIAVPVLFKIFEKNILNEYRYQRTLQMDASGKSIESQQQKARDEIQVIIIEENKKKANVSEKYEEYLAEIKGVSGSNKLGEGPIAQIRKNEYDRERMEYQKMNIRNDSLISLISKRISDLETEKLESRKAAGNAITFADMLQSFNKLRQNNEPIRWASLLINLFFYLIYSAPLIIKILSRKGPYESLVNMRDEILISNLYKQESSTLDDHTLTKTATGLKKKYENIGAEVIDDELKELAKDSQPTILGKFESYLNKILESFSLEASKIEKRAKTLYWQGITFSIIGIMTAFGFLAFWLNYFSIKKFETYHLFALASGTLIIIIIEFLGAWFLKQHRLSAEKSLQILVDKAVLDRFMLIHFAIQDFAGMDQKANHLSELLHTLGKDLKFPHASNNSFDNSDFANDTYASLMNVAKNVKS